MKFKCIAIDDEPPALDLMCGYIQKTPFLELAGRSNSALEILEQITPKKVDLIFVDIEMPDLTGINFSKLLTNGPKIIFTTAYDQYAIEGYRLDALDYLLKPISYEEFLEAAHKGKEYFELIQSANENQSDKYTYMFVRSEYMLKRIDFNDILYIEGLKDYVKFHLQSKKSPVLSLMSLKALEEKLPVKMFMRVHRSYIINLTKVQSVERSIISFEKGEARVSNQYSNDFFNRIERS